MSLDKLKNKIKESIFTLYSNKELNIQFQKTKKNFDGDLTIVVFPLLVVSKKSAEKIYNNLVMTHERGLSKKIIDALNHYFTFLFSVWICYFNDMLNFWHGIKKV